MSDIVGALGSLFPVLNSHPWAMAALIGVVVVAVAMWLAPRIIVATESLINIRSRLKDPDDWASGDSFLRTSDPALWRQNLVFNRLRLDYLNSARVHNRIRAWFFTGSATCGVCRLPQGFSSRGVCGVVG